MITVPALASAASAYFYWRNVNECFATGSSYVTTKFYGSFYGFPAVLSNQLSCAQQVISFLGATSNSQRIADVADYLLQISAPLQTAIALLYWPIRLYNSSLFFDPKFELSMPVLLDLSLHLAPAVIQSLFAVFSPSRSWLATPPTLLPAYGAVAAGLYGWVNYCAGKNGYFVFPVLDQIGPVFRALAFASLPGALYVIRQTLANLQQ